MMFTASTVIRAAAVLALSAALFGVPAVAHGAEAGSDASTPETHVQPDERGAAARAFARNAAPAELAKHYLQGRLLSDLITLTESGATVQVPGMRITKENAAQVRSSVRSVAWEYEAAIRERGFRDVHGTYRAFASSGCARAKSLWVLALSEPGARDVELRQDGFVVSIKQMDPTGERAFIGTTGVIVESSLAFFDPANSDYLLVGVAADDVITVRPDVDAVLWRWPAWAGPPSREALLSCAVVLGRRGGALDDQALARRADAAAEAMVPAETLAVDYADVMARRNENAALLSGELVRIPEKPDARQRYEREKVSLDAREAELRVRIRARGFENLAGHYRATASAACRGVAASWAAGLADGAVHEFEARQDEFVVTFTARAPRERAGSAIVVGSALAVVGAAGTFHALAGSVDGDTIRLRPHVGSLPLRTGTIVSGSPSAGALADCYVTLVRVR